VTPITRFNIIATALAGIILAASISYFFILLPYQEYSRRATELKQYYIMEEKRIIRREVTRVLNELDFLHRGHLKEITATLNLNLTNMKRFIESGRYANIQQVHTMVAHMRKELGYLEQAAYFVFTTEGNLISRCSRQHLLELGMEPDLGDAEITSVLEPLWGAAPKELQNMHWPANADSAPLPLHAIYETSTQNKLRIVAVIPQHISDKDLQIRFLEHLAQVRYGAEGSGYFFIFDLNARPIMSPALVPSFNSDLSPFSVTEKLLLTSRRLAEIAKHDGGYAEYHFTNPTNDNAEESKISYVTVLPRWDWILGTGFYTNALDERILTHQAELLSGAHKRTRIGVIVVLINLLLGLAIAYVTHRYVHRIEAAREEHLKRLEQYSKLLDELCLVSKGDLAGHITYVNDKFCQVSGYTREQMLGEPHNIVRHPSVPKMVFKRMWQRIQAGNIWRGISRNKTSDGNSYYADSVIMPLTDQNGNIVEYIAARYEITELLEKRDEVRLAFATDKLTSLGSRHKLVEDLRTSTEKSCLILFDVVDFGGINQNLGTETADQILLHLSNQMIEFFAAERYSLYRLHSDIFAVLTNTAAHAELHTTVEQFSKTLIRNTFVHTDSGTMNLNLVSGIACNEKDLLTCADAALQHAKQSKVTVAMYNTEIAANQGRTRAYWINEVQQALLDQRLIPYYQPIVHILSGETRRHEALMRMVNISGEIIPPGSFLPIMEQTSHYPEMTRAIIKQACMFFRYRKDSFSVNIAVDDLLHRSTVDFIATTATSYAVTGRLVLELVETENIHNYEVALKALAELKSLGIKIAIDDFGSGFANFSYLSAFPADFVRIDGSLISKINEDEKTRNLVQILIDYAHSEGIEVIAEFVSSAEILATVTQMGCDYAQGYHFGAPAPGESIQD